MKIQIIKSYSCEPCFAESSRDTRYELDIDGKLKVQAVHCNDKHSSYLGDSRIERIFVGEKSFWPSQFSEFEAEVNRAYSAEDLEEKIQEFLENQ